MTQDPNQYLEILETQVRSKALGAVVRSAGKRKKNNRVRKRESQERSQDKKELE